MDLQPAQPEGTDQGDPTAVRTLPVLAAAEPAELSVAEVREVLHELLGRLLLVGKNGMAKPGILRGDRHDAGFELLQGAEEGAFHLTHHDESGQGAARGVNLAELSEVELVLGAEKQKRDTSLLEKFMQAVLDVAEERTLIVELHAGAQDKADRCRLRSRQKFGGHALGPVAAAPGVTPDFLVGLLGDRVAPAVERHGNEGLRDAQVFGDLLLGNAALFHGESCRLRQGSAASSQRQGPQLPLATGGLITIIVG